MRTRRTYGHCAKGGHEKELTPQVVCEEHRGTSGRFTHCAVCGEAFDYAPTRDYVCGYDLVYNPEPRPEHAA